MNSAEEMKDKLGPALCLARMIDIKHGTNDT